MMLKKIYKEIDLFEERCDFKIDKKWLDNLALHTQVVKKSEINYQHGRVLYSSLRDYIKKRVKVFKYIRNRNSIRFLINLYVKSYY